MMQYDINKGPMPAYLRITRHALPLRPTVSLMQIQPKHLSHFYCEHLISIEHILSTAFVQPPHVTLYLRLNAGILVSVSIVLPMWWNVSVLPVYMTFHQQPMPQKSTTQRKHQL